MTEFGTRAAKLSVLGFPVFPVVHEGKRPLTEHGCLDATLDGEQIWEWSDRWPNANVGLQTAGLVVVDRDCLPDGSDNPWPEDPVQRQSLYSCPVARTPRGGQHHYFRAPAGRTFRNSQGKLAPHVDIRADGGYVVAPGSTVNGREYQWIREPNCLANDLPIAPDWLVDRINASEYVERPATSAAVPDWKSDAAVLDRARRYLAKVEPAISGQGGSSVTFRAACILVLGFGLPLEDAYSLLTEWNQTCVPPWSEKELRHKLDDANKRGGDRGYMRDADPANYRHIPIPDYAQPSEQNDDFYDRLAAAEHGESPSIEDAAANTNRRPRLKIRSVGTSAHVAKLHPMLIEGIQRRGEIANIVAPPKVGKTWLSAAKSLCLAAGRPWLGRFRTTRSKVLVVDAELHGPTFDERLPRVAMALGIEPEEWEGRIDVINTRGERMDLMTLCAELRHLAPGEYDLCVIDALYRFIPKGFDENSNSDMNTLYNEIDSVAMKLGLAFDIVHHSTKGLQSDKAVTDVGAGAGSQSRAADTHMVLRQHEADGIYVIDAAVRSWAPLQAFCIRWDYPIWQLADEFDPADLKRPNAKRGDSAARAEAGNGGGDDPNVAKVIEAMRLYPAGETARVIRAKTKLSGVKCQPILDMLVADGMAQETLTKKGRQPVAMYKLIEVGQVGQSGSDPADPGSGSTRSIERVTQTHYPPAGSRVPRLEDIDVFE